MKNGKLAKFDFLEQLDNNIKSQTNEWAGHFSIAYIN
jgi:hypothetical protein